MFLQKSCTHDIASSWFLFLFRCLSSCKCCDLMLLCLTLLILLFLSKLFRLWLIISTSWWYWCFLGVMSDKKTSHLNFSLYSSANNFSLYALSSGCSLWSNSFIPTWSKIFDGLLMLCNFNMFLALLILPQEIVIIDAFGQIVF